MTGTNGFLPWATGVGANVLNDADYAVSDALPQGAQRGRLPSPLYNKINRQTSVVASMIGQFIVRRGNVDANDSQSIALLEANFEAALAAYVTGIVLPGAPNIPTVVTTSRTFYIRPDGNDANDGSANDPAHAFQTIAGAEAATTNIITTTGQVNFQLGVPGTYAMPPNGFNRGGRNLRIVGDTNNQVAYVIAGSGSAIISAFTPYAGTTVLAGLMLVNTGTIGDTLGVSGNATVILDHVTFTIPNGGTPTTGFHMGVYANGTLTVGPGVVISSSAGGWLNASKGSAFFSADCTLLFTNTPTWSIAGIQANTAGAIRPIGSLPPITGTANGPRYNVGPFSTLSSAGAGANAYPGSSAGVNNGGQYV